MKTIVETTVATGKMSSCYIQQPRQHPPHWRHKYLVQKVVTQLGQIRLQGRMEEELDGK